MENKNHSFRRIMEQLYTQYTGTVHEQKPKAILSSDYLREQNPNISTYSEVLKQPYSTKLLVIRPKAQ
jgi:hypothetical protein